MLRDWPTPQVRSLGLSLLCGAQTVRGDLAGARATLAQVDELLQKNRLHPRFVDAVEQARVRLWIAEGNRPALQGWSEQNAALVAGRPLRFRDEARQIELCRTWLALGRNAGARGAAGGAGQCGGAAPRQPGGHSIAAGCCAQPGTRPGAGGARRGAAPGRARRIYADIFKAGEAAEQAIRTWLQQGRAQEDARLVAYAQSLLAAFAGLGEAKIESVLPASNLPEALSGREPEDASAGSAGAYQPADCQPAVHFCPYGKEHVENIHGKLGVTEPHPGGRRGAAVGVDPAKIRPPLSRQYAFWTLRIRP